MTDFSSRLGNEWPNSNWITAAKKLEVKKKGKKVEGNEITDCRRSYTRMKGRGGDRCGRQFDRGLVIGTKYRCNSTQFGLSFSLQNFFIEWEYSK